MSWLERQLNRITMYHLVVYTLIGLLVIAEVLGIAGLLPFSGPQLFASTLFLVAVCWLVNRFFAWGFDAPAHDDSAYITALILALIITPLRKESDLVILIWAPVLAIAGKYILAIHRQHIFNPAAFGVALTSLVLGASASWWVATPWMLGPAVIGGFLILRKIRRFQVAIAYLVVLVIATSSYALTRSTELVVVMKQLLVYSPVVFFSSVMLTEPFTMPPTRRWRLIFGGLVGFLSASFVHIGSFYFTPELALLAGNLFGWFITRRERYVLTLKKKISIAPTITDLVFEGQRIPVYRPGQYMEWSMPHEKVDGRGSRRYFTIASSPTENEIRMGVKFYQPSSTYKQALAQLQPGQQIIAEQLDGDFTLTKNKLQRQVFIAGGIGITPFRSMIKYLLDTKDARPMTLLYANQHVEDIVYTDVIEQAGAELGLKTVYILSDEQNIPANWTGRRGFITAHVIEEEIENFDLAHYYLSGPQGMVTSYLKMLHKLGIASAQITTDYFPGFA